MTRTVITETTAPVAGGDVVPTPDHPADRATARLDTRAPLPAAAGGHPAHYWDVDAACWHDCPHAAGTVT
jgi:hypothetical protein